MGYIIERKETNEVKELKGWFLLYGRRKVGKTFLVQHFLKPENYFLVKRSLAIVNDKEYVYKEFLSEVKNLLQKNKIVAVDEFQRLPEDFLDELSRIYPKGKVILLGSSLGIAKKVFAVHSPLLGLIDEYRLGLFQASGIFYFIGKHFGAEYAFKVSSLFVEPWIIKHLEKKDPTELTYQMIKLNKGAIKALIGEIFTEEEKELTIRYETILRALSLGCWKAKEIASLLFSRGLIERPEVGLVKAYLKNMEKMDLVESLPILKSKEKYFRIKSPIIDLYFFLAEKYNLEEEDLIFKAVEGVIRSKLGFYLERFMGKILAEFYEGRNILYIGPDKEIDIVITRGKQIIAIGEVKTKAKVGDVKKFQKKVENFAGKKIFISSNKIEAFEEVETLSAQELWERIKKRHKKQKTL